MEPSAVSLVLVVVLSLTATLPGPTIVHAEGSNVTEEETNATTNVPREGQDNHCLLRREDLINAQLKNEIDTRLNERDSPLNGLDTRLTTQMIGLDARLTERDTRQNEFDTRLNRMDGRLDRIETAISDMKEYLQHGMEAMDKKVEWALTDIKPQQNGVVKEKSKVYGGCQEALAHGVTCSGVYTIAADCDNSTRDVYCEQRLDGGGWTVFQVRFNGSVDFYNDWDTYKTGFGNLTGEFWLGNKNLHQLTKHHDQQLKIELTAPDGEVQYADYSEFYVAPESDKFRLTVTGYSSGDTPGDSMTYGNGQQFSTKNQDNDQSPGSCATSYVGAWWYNACHYANLNGLYGSTETAKGLNWYHWRGYTVSMKATRMMFKKKP